jgi:hypothetical protein
MNFPGQAQAGEGKRKQKTLLTLGRAGFAGTSPV